MEGQTDAIDPTATFRLSRRNLIVSGASFARRPGGYGRVLKRVGIQY